MMTSSGRASPTAAAPGGWQLAEVIADDGVSGGRRERLKRLAARVRATGARAVVVYHLDRFARDLAGTLDHLRRFSRRGLELHVVVAGAGSRPTAPPGSSSRRSRAWRRITAGG